MTARFLSCLILFTASLDAASPGAVYEIPRTDLPIEVDGRLDEDAWQGALVLDLPYETRPGENVAPPVQTTCRLLYDETHLYYGCTALDPHPEQIRARLADRDQAVGDDTVGLAIDTFDDRNRAYVLDMNPLGVQNDRLFTEADQRSDPTWDAIWESAGRLTGQGFEVEAAIPFSSLRFQRTDGPQTWGFNLRRYYPRESLHRIAITPYQRDDRCRLCQSAKLRGFEGVDPGRNLEIVPTLTGVSVATRDAVPDGELTRSDPDVDPGLSVRWSMTPNLTLNGTVNPDFSQVEADVAQLDVNRRFALFFEERRPFFLEGSDFFATPLRAVHTRTVADPSWGAKVSGKEGKNAVGAFVARDEFTTLLLPGSEGSSVDALDRESNAAVLRYRRDVGTSSTVGVLYTDRSAGAYSNRLVGFDTHLRLDKANTLTVQAIGSQTRYPSEVAERNGLAASSLDDVGLFVAYGHDRRNWSLGTKVFDLGDGFRADLGFVPRVGIREASVGGEYRWFGDAQHWFTRFGVGGEWERQERHGGGLLEETFGIGLNYQGPMLSRLNLGIRTGDEVFAGRTFDASGVRFGGFFQPTRDLGFGLRARAGRAIDFTEARAGDSLSLSPSMQVRLGRHLRLDLSHQYRTLDVDAGRLFVANQTEMRLVYQLNVRTFVRAIVQNTRIDRAPERFADEVERRTADLFGQLLFSYKVNAQTAVFVGYTGEYVDLLEDGLVETGNSVFVKLGYSWLP